jgi:hypothetical protein
MCANPPVSQGEQSYWLAIAVSFKESQCMIVHQGLCINMNTHILLALRSGYTAFHASRTSECSRDIPMRLLAQEAMKEDVSTSRLDLHDIERTIPRRQIFSRKVLVPAPDRASSSQRVYANQNSPWPTQVNAALCWHITLSALRIPHIVSAMV